jgi:hypothetical protein
LEKPFVLAERCELGQLALRANEDTTTPFRLDYRRSVLPRPMMSSPAAMGTAGSGFIAA